MHLERPAPLSDLPTGPTFRLVIEPCPTPSRYPEWECIDVRAIPTDATRAEHGLHADEEAHDDGADALRAAYRASGRPCGTLHASEGRYAARCLVTYVGAYRVWAPFHEELPFRAPEVCT